MSGNIWKKIVIFLKLLCIHTYYYVHNFPVICWSSTVSYLYMYDFVNKFKRFYSWACSMLTAVLSFCIFLIHLSFSKPNINKSCFNELVQYYILCVHFIVFPKTAVIVINYILKIVCFKRCNNSHTNEKRYNMNKYNKCRLIHWKYVYRYVQNSHYNALFTRDS